jgi:hypothetical protein
MYHHAWQECIFSILEKNKAKKKKKESLQRLNSFSGKCALMGKCIYHHGCHGGISYAVKLVYL